MSAADFRVGDTRTVKGTVRTLEQIAPEGHVRVTLDVAPVDPAQVHRDALADTHDAYTSFHGWVLDCSWCDYEAVGKTKAEALRHMQHHYNLVLPEGAEIR